MADHLSVNFWRWSQSWSVVVDEKLYKGPSWVSWFSMLGGLVPEPDESLSNCCRSSVILDWSPLGGVWRCTTFNFVGAMLSSAGCLLLTNAINLGSYTSALRESSWDWSTVAHGPVGWWCGDDDFSVRFLLWKMGGSNTHSSKCIFPIPLR